MAIAVSLRYTSLQANSLWTSPPGNPHVDDFARFSCAIGILLDKRTQIEPLDWSLAPKL